MTVDEFNREWDHLRENYNDQTMLDWHDYVKSNFTRCLSIEAQLYIAHAGKDCPLFFGSWLKELALDAVFEKEVLID